MHIQTCPSVCLSSVRYRCIERFNLTVTSVLQETQHANFNTDYANFDSEVYIHGNVLVERAYIILMSKNSLIFNEHLHVTTF